MSLLSTKGRDNVLEASLARSSSRRQIFSHLVNSNFPPRDRFGFASTSTLDTLLDRPNVTLEEVLDEEDLLQECKGQNQKLIDYLQQPRVLKRLLEHVVGTADVGGGSGRDWEEKVRFK